MTLKKMPKTIKINSKTHLFVDERVAIAKTTSVSSDLVKLIKDKSCDVREAVAANPAATVEVLMRAMHDEYWPVRVAAVSNPSANVEVLLKGITDECNWVRRAASKSPDVPYDELIRVAFKNACSQALRALFSRDETPVSQIVIQANLEKLRSDAHFIDSLFMLPSIDLPKG